MLKTSSLEAGFSFTTDEVSLLPASRVGSLATLWKKGAMPVIKSLQGRLLVVRNFINIMVFD